MGTGQQLNRLFYVTGKRSGFHFLVDPGVEASPSAKEQKHRQERSGLHAVNGTPIATYCSRSPMLDLGL